MPYTPPSSLWVETAPHPGFPPLPGTARADVAIIGAGIVGLSTALVLQRAGYSVAIIEARRVAAQVSGQTTAKLSTQHNLIYDYLLQQFGEDGACTYAQSNQAALEQIASWVEELGIDCDFERQPSFLYTRDPARREELERETEAAARLGLPASFVTETPLSVPVAAAVRFDGQAQFHPCRYLLGIADHIVAEGGTIFEQTRALDVRGERPRRVITDRGTVTARDVVIATNLPFLDRGGYFAKAFPRRHLVMSARVAPGELPAGMFLSVDSPSRSLRGYQRGEDAHVILVGESFTPGTADTMALRNALEASLREQFPEAELSHWWGNQDYDSMDKVPFIGALTPGTRHVHVACGFNAWGMTLGTVAAILLGERIQGRDHPWAQLYRSTRLKPRAGGARLLQGNLHAARHWVGDRLSRGRRSIHAMSAGEGGLARKGSRTVAAFRDESGRLHLLSPVCTHLRCRLAWNAAERSWDCPCHGSRFDIRGRVLNGPAVDDLESREDS